MTQPIAVFWTQASPRCPDDIARPAALACPAEQTGAQRRAKSSRWVQKSDRVSGVCAGLSLMHSATSRIVVMLDTLRIDSDLIFYGKYSDSSTKSIESLITISSIVSLFSVSFLIKNVSSRILITSP